MEAEQLDVEDHGNRAGETGGACRHRVIDNLGHLRVAVAHRVFAPDDVTGGVIAVGLRHFQAGRHADIDLGHVDLFQDRARKDGACGMVFIGDGAHAAVRLGLCCHLQRLSRRERRERRLTGHDVRRATGTQGGADAQGTNKLDDFHLYLLGGKAPKWSPPSDARRLRRV